MAEIIEYPIRTTNTKITAKYDKGVWEVLLNVIMSRTSNDGVEEVCNYEVKSFDKNLNRAQNTVQMSAVAYLNTHTEDEIYANAKNQTPDIKDTQA